MANILKRLDLILILLLFLTTPLFFFKLGQNSLVSFDEAWYAEISKNILKTNDFLNLYWNGEYYIDHPPANFWLTTASFKLLGINEFSARFPQALMGFLSLVVLFFIGKEFFNRGIGLVSSFALASSYWFVFRARSGNLDIGLTFFFLLTFYFAIKASKSKKYSLLFIISLVLLILSKSVVPFTIIPALLIIFWGSKVYKLKDLIFPTVLFFSILGIWVFSQLDNHDHFIQRYLSIGLPGVKTETPYMENLKLMNEYLHNGIGKWFWPGVISIIFGIFFRQKRFLILFIFFLSFFTPFISSNKGHIWHLIPLHPFLILSFFGFSFVALEKIFTNTNLLSYVKKLNLSTYYFIKSNYQMLILLTLFSICSYYSFIQIRRIWYEFVDIPAFISDEAILSKEAGNYPYNLSIDGDFGPTAVFYSGKLIRRIAPNEFSDYFENPYQLLIFNKHRLEAEKIQPQKYKILKQDRDKVLILTLFSGQ